MPLVVGFTGRADLEMLEDEAEAHTTSRVEISATILAEFFPMTKRGFPYTPHKSFSEGACFTLPSTSIRYLNPVYHRQFSVLLVSLVTGEALTWRTSQVYRDVIHK
jgi:hypothetical protein